MPLTKKQMKEVITIYIPSPLEQIQKNQIKMCSELKEIKEVQGKIRDWKHKHEKDFPTILTFLKNTLCPQVDKLTIAIKTLMGSKEWKKLK